MGASSTKFDKNSTAMQTADNMNLAGKVVLVTGANTGLGKETVRVLALHGAKVYMLCRNTQKGGSARQEIITSIQESNKEFDDAQLVVMEMDLSSLLSVRRFAAKFTALNEPIHYLICNAGIMAIPQWRASADGYESQFATNHLGHFYLAVLLTPMLLQSKQARLIVLSSAAHSSAPSLANEQSNWITKGLQRKDGPVAAEYTFRGLTEYGVSKACNIMFAREYNRRYREQGVIAVSLHPGVIRTQIFSELGTAANFMMGMGSMFFKSVPQGAATTIRCVSLPDAEIKPGHYYKDCNDVNNSVRVDLRVGPAGANNPDKQEEEKEEKQANDANIGADAVEQSDQYRLWQWSELLVTQKGFKLDLDGFAEEENQRAQKLEETPTDATDAKASIQKEAPIEEEQVQQQQIVEE